MKVKNIKQYRKIYKEEIRLDEHKNENYIGNFYDTANGRVKGWFDIYFGDTDGSGTAQQGVNNKLKSFLDMAKDGQAVYEFLQNAVDAGSTRFLMFYETDKVTNNDYLMIINNGEMFSPAHIRSILNIGSSTKSNETEKIGQFGIGFKLAHRLVGKDNALDELIQDLTGPILFSWKNSEILNFNDNIEEVDFDYEVDKKQKMTISDSHPWLFKILLTTFPSGYKEKPISWKGETTETAPFTEEDLRTLSRWIQNKREFIESDFEEGSLFLMKLGEGKLKELQSESNLDQGVRFSLAIIKETGNNIERRLEKAVINNSEVEFPELEYHKILLPKDKETINDYAYIRYGKTEPELREVERQNIHDELDIEILFGFRKRDEVGDFFRGAPNFFLYFPLSEEVHNYNFILHSNALYKGSNRTFLHSGGGNGMNERLFKVIIKYLEADLRDLYHKDKEKFKNLYYAILTSEETNLDRHKWVNKSFAYPLYEMLRRIIPIRGGAYNKSSLEAHSVHIFLKDTKIEFQNQIKWFDWESLDEKTTDKIVEKLNLNVFNVYHALNEINENTINHWMGKSSSKARSFIDELIAKPNHGINFSDIKNKFSKIKWIECSDGKFRSISTIENDNCIILYKGLFENKDLFQKLGLLTTENDESAFVDKFRNNFQQNELKQLTYSNLTKLFSSLVKDEHLDTLSNQEKYTLFELFRQLDDSPRERLKELKLYKNRLGKYLPFKHLINYELDTYSWLDDFKIDQSQLTDPAEYFLNNLVNDEIAYYENVIFPLWDIVLRNVTSNNDYVENVEKIRLHIINLFNISNWSDKNSKLLSDHENIIFKGEVIESISNYFDDKLLDLNDNDYEKYQQIGQEFFDIEIIDRCQSALYYNEPFGYENARIIFNAGEAVSEEIIIQILKLAGLLNFNLFEEHVIIKTKQGYIIESIEEGKFQFDPSDEVVKTALADNDKYVALPSGLIEYAKPHLANSNLFQQFLSDDEIDKLDLINFIFQQNTELKFNYLKSLEDIFLDADWGDSNNNEQLLRLISEFSDHSNFKEIKQKITIFDDEHEVSLADLPILTQYFELDGIELDISKILNTEADDTNFVYKFQKSIAERGIINSEQLSKIFISEKVKLNSLKVEFTNAVNTDNLIRNTDQLIFLLKTNLYNDNDNFYVPLAFNQGVTPLKNVLYLNKNKNSGVIKSQLILDDRFNDLDERLDLPFEISKNLNIKDIECFDDLSYNEAFIEERQVEVIKYIYSNNILELNNSSKIRIYLQNSIKHKIHADSKYLLPEEVLPNELLQWLESDADDRDFKIEFFKNLHIKSELSPIIELRKYLINDSKEYYGNWQDLNAHALNNTLKWLSQLEVYSLHVNVDRNKIELLQNILLNLFQDNKIVNESIPLLVYKNSTQRIGISSESNDIHKIDWKILESLQKANDRYFNDFLSTNNYTILFPSIENESLSVNINDLDLNEIIVNKEFVSKGHSELSDETYNQWKVNKNIRLYSCQELCYDLLIDEEYIGRNINLDEECEFVQKDNFLKIYFSDKISINHLIELSSQYHNEHLYNLHLNLKAYQEHFAEFNSNIIQAIENSENEEIKSQLAYIKDQLEYAAEKKEILTTFESEKEYSHSWFESYLNLLNNYNKQGSTEKRKSIQFSKIQPVINNEGLRVDKFYKLKGANSFIGINIEEVTDIKLKLIYKNNKVSTLNAVHISKSGQDVIIQLAKNIDRVESVYLAEIKFTPVLDLASRLLKSFESLEPWKDLYTESRVPYLNFIYGPPGTGKTTKLVNIIRGEDREILNISENAKILVLTPTNKAADVLCKKLIDQNFDNIVRLGGQTDYEIDESYYSQNLETHQLNHGLLVASTIHRLPYYELKGNNENRLLYQYPWDYIIIDEASMVNLPYLIFALVSGRDANNDVEVLIAGDPKQIPPVQVVLDQEVKEILENRIDENIYKMIGLSDFRKEANYSLNRKETEIGKVFNLSKQYRSLIGIGNAFSKYAYGGHLEHHRNDEIPLELPEGINQLIKNQVTFVDIPVTNHTPLYAVEMKLFGSSFHIYSAILVYEFLKKFIAINAGENHYRIGLISPYKIQANLMNRLVSSLDLNNSNISIYCDTVHGFQGDECDIVFFVVNPNNVKYTGHPNSLLSKEYIYNVAISRARDYLVVLHPQEIKNPHIRQIEKYAQQGMVSKINSREIEKYLFDKESFIEENTFVTTHDTINFFEGFEWRYYIKRSNSAIDFQLNEKG
ncbi:AAA domain-containing protein [Weeksellaceae bacterium KMM 9713]|uniref:AAA domain-containing protein n=1 Tax=Profundicola chukchiensis TaxID=2961959 RepID=A0A9X4MZ90_9FLAO|nr:AAA domain-containing protein [Profundicola chukchiensis]MDG4945707.1 AAA domain-containing protein [Profundicola chukchiensis]